MKIGFDAKRITHNGTGLGNYSCYVINSLAAGFPDNNYMLYTPSAGQDKLRGRIQDAVNIDFRYPSARLDKMFPSLWRTSRMVSDLKRDAVEVFHGLSNELPAGLRSAGISSVVTIHDLIFLVYPQFYKPVDRKIYTKKFCDACRQADRVIAVSQCTKRDIVRFFDTQPDKIDVVYQGCSDIFRQEIPETRLAEVRAKYGLDGPFMLSVGSIEGRKNILSAVEALPYIEEDIRLVIVGRRTAYTDMVDSYIKENNLHDRVLILERVDNTDLPALYKLAEIFIYPSLYEGFGIPIVEALESGVPVVAATGSCLEEAGGPHSLYVDPHDPRAIADAVRRIIMEPGLASEMRARGKEYAARFNSQTSAREIMDIYRKVSK